jgi:NAD-dependent dihydropyrimidine dehydrogenase PreA subunit
MAKILKISFPQKCIGCELCVMETQRQLKKFGLEGSLVRVFKERDESSDKMVFSVHLDPQVQKMDVQKIKNICPTGVFTIEETEALDEFTY